MAGLSARKKDRYTWDDYRKWPDDERWEIIDGEAFAMSPAPTPDHQWVLQSIFVQLWAFFRGKRCRPYVAPVDVKLADDTVVQPDIAVVCAPERVLKTHVDGAPALVVEILSPSSMRQDRVRKFERYARAGIPEYWLVSLEGQLIEVFTLKDGFSVLDGGYAAEEILRSAAFPQLELNVAEVVKDIGGHSQHVVREGRPRYGTRQRRSRKPSRVIS